MIAMLSSRALPATLLALAALLLASSCSVLPKREPIKIYEPSRAEQSASAEWPQVSWSLLVSRPMTGQLLESDRITVRPAPGSVQVYKGASWSDTVPNLLQTTLLTRFEDSQKILSVSRPGAIVRGDFQLQTELRAFESVYVQPDQPQAVIEVYARLVRTSDSKVVAARSFKASEPSASEEVAAVVDAFSRSLDRLSGQLVGWTLSTGNQHQARSAPGPARP